MSGQSITRRSALKTAGAAGLVGLAGCSGGESSSDTLSAAFIYQAEVSDVGWDRAHEDARQAVTEEFDWLETDFSEAVATGDVKQVIEQYINNGTDVKIGRAHV